MNFVDYIKTVSVFKSHIQNRKSGGVGLGNGFGFRNGFNKLNRKSAMFKGAA